MSSVLMCSYHQWIRAHVISVVFRLRTYVCNLNTGYWIFIHFSKLVVRVPRRPYANPESSRSWRKIWRKKLPQEKKIEGDVNTSYRHHLPEGVSLHGAGQSWPPLPSVSWPPPSLCAMWVWEHVFVGSFHHYNLMIFAFLIIELWCIRDLIN